eukprot:1192188-Prorocentrum_minimum.AAC.5
MSVRYKSARVVKRTGSDPEVIGPEGVEKLCADLDVAPSDVRILMLAFKMNAAKMGYFTALTRVSFTELFLTVLGRTFGLAGRMAKCACTRWSRRFSRQPCSASSSSMRSPSAAQVRAYYIDKRAFSSRLSTIMTESLTELVPYRDTVSSDPDDTGNPISMSLSPLGVSSYLLSSSLS